MLELIKKHSLVRFLLTILLLLVTPCVANAQFDDFEKLEGTSVLFAGEFQSMTCPVYGKYDCLKWPTNLLKLKNQNLCIIPSSMTACGRFGCKGLLVRTKTGEVELFAFESFPVTVSRSGVKSVKCPEMY